jgi:hypothetical protein
MLWEFVDPHSSLTVLLISAQAQRKVCGTFFFFLLRFFTFDRVDSIIFYSAVFLFLLLLFACEYDTFG